MRELRPAPGSMRSGAVYVWDASKGSKTRAYFECPGCGAGVMAMAEGVIEREDAGAHIGICMHCTPERSVYMIIVYLDRGEYFLRNLSSEFNATELRDAMRSLKERMAAVPEWMTNA